MPPRLSVNQVTPGIGAHRPDAPAFGPGAGGFRSSRPPGALRHDAIAQLGPAVPPPRVPMTTVSAKSILKNVENVDGEDRNAISDDFDWLTSFATEKLAFYPEPVNTAQQATRSRMRRLLTSSQLARNIFRAIAEPARKDRAERIAWILNDGDLGNVGIGTRQQVKIPPAPPSAVGIVHAHPAPPTFISPPSHAPGDEDYDKTLAEAPLQFVVECDSGRLWGQFPKARTCLIGSLGRPDGFLRLIDANDPTQQFVYRTESLDDWEAETPKIREKLRLQRLNKAK